MGLISGVTRRSTVQTYLYLLFIVFWAGVTAFAVPEDSSFLNAAVAFACLGLAWASSSFDPRQDSKTHLIWQYAAPWVVGGMSFLTGPTGLFLGSLTGSAMVGLLTGVGLGALLGGVLLFWICVAAAAFYAFRESRAMGDHSLAQTLKGLVQYGRSRGLNLELSSAMVSLCWSFFQGLTIVGLMAMGIKFSGIEGLLGMLLWTLLMVLSVMRFHLAARGTLKRGQRFGLLWSAITLGGGVGLWLS